MMFQQVLSLGQQNLLRGLALDQLLLELGLKPIAMWVEVDPVVSYL
uniref:Uncharacterized protein n=1 Tax=Picea glauca TaxID=3330 RepID=A0A101LZQ4_PICGL|nr:hypothetical protein ABT39_MTgene5190 [Picea glauca]